MIESLIEPTELEPNLQVQLIEAERACRLVLCGELCRTTLIALEAQVDQLGCMPCQEVEVDLASLTRLDVVGANVLFGLSHYVTARGGVFRIIGSNEAVAATLQEITTDLIAANTDAPSAIDCAL